MNYFQLTTIQDMLYLSWWKISQLALAVIWPYRILQQMILTEVAEVERCQQNTCSVFVSQAIWNKIDHIDIQGPPHTCQFLSPDFLYNSSVYNITICNTILLFYTIIYY